MAYYFDQEKYITKGIQINIPLELQVFMWNKVLSLVDSGREMDYLQIFSIKKGEHGMTIHHSQEEPIPFERDYLIYNDDLIAAMGESVKIYIIDNKDQE